MATPSRIESPVYVNGALGCLELNIPDRTVDDAAVATDADIDPVKMRHQFTAVYEQESSATAATETRTIHYVYGATGESISVGFATITPCTGAATITIDVRKNGSSILSANIVLDNVNIARTIETGTIADEVLAAGDMIEVVVTAVAGGGVLGTGLYGYIVTREDAQ